MKALDKLQKCQEDNNSMICLGLDLDPKRMPAEYTKDSKGMFDFALKIVNATSDKVCAYKPNLAFYESFGTDGISVLKMIIDRIPENIPVILDAKRGDIGNTASHYAHALYELLGADWVTLNPYMGYDSLRPFLEYKDKGAFILCLTSNPGSKDFQVLMVDNKPLYQIVAEKVVYWNKSNNCGLVVGATAPQQLKEIRAYTESMPLLIPGVGAQGGSLEEAALNGTDNFQKPALINVSRSILYASTEEDFADRAREELVKLNSIVSKIRGNGNETHHFKSQESKPQDHKEPEKIVVHESPQPKEPENITTDEQPQHNEPENITTEKHPQHKEPENITSEKQPQPIEPENITTDEQPQPKVPENITTDEQPQHKEPDNQTPENTNENNHQNQNTTNIQPVQEDKPKPVHIPVPVPALVPNENILNRRAQDEKRDDSQEKIPNNHVDQSVDLKSETEEKPEVEDKPKEEKKPKVFHKITPPPILKPPPLPYSNLRNDSDNKK